jgi:hypothetical protein
MTDPMLTVREAVRAQILRRAPRLSTGAYGDEGQILLELDRVAFEGLQRITSAEGRDLALAWLSDQARPSTDPAMHTWFLMLHGLMTRWRPLREAFGTDSLHGLQEAVRRELGRFAPGEPDAYEWLADKICEVLAGKGLIDLRRGDPIWQVLLRTDLLAPLGPFVRESDMVAVETGVAG